jgi:DNA (cytosine-5)-methyltransferase 1
MKYGSVCSGVEAATVAWHDLGWEPQFFSEFDAFPSAVLNHHYPNVPNFGDMTKYKEWNLNEKSIDLLVGGTPCQSFSISGLRKGLGDERGNLMLEYLRMADEFKPKWIVWENVVGVLSSNGGRDFGTFLTALGKIGYGFAYRVLDAQYFGVPQRRRRVFVVGCLGDWRSAGKVLFESESLSGNPPPSREKGERVAPTVTRGAPFSSTGNERVETEAYITYSGEVAPTITASGTPFSRVGFGGNTESEAFVTFARVGHGHYSDKNDIASTVRARDYKDATDLITFSPQNSASNGLSVSKHTVPTLQTTKQSAVAIPIHDQATRHSGKRGEKRDGKGNGLGIGKDGAPMNTLTRGDRHAVSYDMKVRRLTPRECERLQGFPDDWTKIEWRGKKPELCPDAPRYKAMGNSMAVPVMRWIGQQINQVHKEGNK